jgi:transposase
MPAGDRVRERRKAAALARHYRDEEGLSTAEIARRLGRAQATVKAYLYDPSYANKRPTDSPLSGATVLGAPCHARTSICKRLLGSRCDGTRPASRLPDLFGCGSLERRYSGPRYCP